MPSGMNLRGSAADELSAERSATQRSHREVGETPMVITYVSIFL